MNEQQVIDLMESSQTSQEWSDNCDKVKAACGGNYPSFWWPVMKLSGRMDKILARWDSDSSLRLTSL